jgi:UDP-N-acetylglucosamine diphosphorylase/glucosamine-1-phosphate N-acetyltransferase
MTVIIILAAGEGKRMNSDIPKVLHKVQNIPMLARVVIESQKINPSKIIVVVGKHRDVIIDTLSQYTSIQDIEFIVQENPMGTGHAIQCCKYLLLPYIHENVLILYGDVPLIKSDTLYELASLKSPVTIGVTYMVNPYGYGRIVKINDTFDKIIEEKDCDSIEKNIQLVNCGIYCIKAEYIYNYIMVLDNNNVSREYYLTDLIEIIKKSVNIDIDLYYFTDRTRYQIMGVNTIEQLRDVEEIIF